MKQIKGLDTLRAFAVIFVILAHWNSFYPCSDSVKAVERVIIPDGATGVYIFFTLSGFLITSILVNARFTGNHSSGNIFKNFIIRRILRIFPIYYIFLFALYHLFTWPAMNQELPWYLTYTTNFMVFRSNDWSAMASHLWTLAVEEQFYLIWPWLILFLNEKYLKYLFPVCIIVGVVTTYLNTRIEPFMMYNCIDSFAIGGYYAYARLDAARTRKFEKVVKRLAPLLVLIYFGWKLQFVLYQVETGIFLKKTIESLLSIWLIILIINNKSEPAKKYLLENKALNFMGRISYCIYLVHPYFPRLINPLMERAKVKFHMGQRTSELITGFYTEQFICLCVLLLTCTLSYVLIEKPILSLKRHFEYK